MLGTKVDDTFMRVTRHDFVKRIDPKDLRIRDTRFLKEMVVPINRRIVYEPPIDDILEENSAYDSEGDDELLTTYTRTGHFLILNLK